MFGETPNTATVTVALPNPKLSRDPSRRGRGDEHHGHLIARDADAGCGAHSQLSLKLSAKSFLSGCHATLSPETRSCE